MKWSVTLETEGDRALSREEVVELADAVAMHSGIASGIGAPSYGAQLIVDADDEAGAIEAATAVFVEAAARANLPIWPITRTEAISEDDEIEEYG